MTPDQTRGSDLPRRTDVLVVGAGPTGLSLACGLARRGVDHVVIDHAPLVAANSQAALIDARTLEALDTIDAGSPLVRRGVILTRFTLCDRDEQLLAVHFSELPSRHPYMLMVPENTAEGLLAERLASYGSPIRRPVTAVALQQNADGVTVELWDGSTSRSGSPTRRSIVARYVVGCDGMHSQIRRALEIPFIGPSRTECFVMADVRMTWSLPRSEAQLFFSAEGFLIVAPLPDDRYRILATVDRNNEYPELDDVQKILASRGPRSSPALVRDVAWSAGFQVHHRLATHYRSGRVFLAGDAAHVHSPASGQGMISGIQDALYLADKLSDVLVELADGSVLNDYEDERRPVAESALRLTRRLSRIATMQGRVGPSIRNRSLRVVGLLPALRRSFAYQLSGFDGSRGLRGGPRDRKLLLASNRR